MPLMQNGFSIEQMRRRKLRGTVEIRITWKTAIKNEMVVVDWWCHQMV